MVTGKRPARSEKRAASRNFDDGWIVAMSLIDGRSVSWLIDRYSGRNSSSEDVGTGGNDAAADAKADRVGTLSSGLESTIHGSFGGLV